MYVVGSGENMKMHKKILVLLLSVCILIPNFASAKSFLDTKDHWSREYVDKLSDMGLISGYDGGYFKPDQAISRVEFYAVINQMANLKKTYPIFFTDVNQNDWYYKEVQKAVKAGYIVPTSGPLNPNADITRIEVVKVLGYMYNLKKKAAPDFKDIQNLSESDKGSLGALVSVGALGGYPDGNFKPGGAVSRAEISRILIGLIDKAGLPAERSVPDSKIKFGEKDLYE